MQFPIIKGQMRKLREIKIRLELAIDMTQDVEVEIGRDSSRVIIRGFYNLNRLPQVEPNKN